MSKDEKLNTEKEKNKNCTHEICFTFCKNKKMGEHEVKFVTIDKITKQTEDEYLFRFNIATNHDPGQFYQVSLFGIGESAISICSHQEDYFEMSIRNVGNVTAHLCALKAGAKIGLRGPYGRGYEMKNFEGDNVIIVAGGSGVAPVRGIIQYIEKKREKFGSVDIFMGFKTVNNMIFESDYKQWKKANMNVDIIVSEVCRLKGIKHGIVTDLLESPSTESNEKKIVFVCGPPPMIAGVVKVLLEKGFNKDQIYISEERQMKCAVGRCGHCMIEDKYCCTDGPVFRYDELEKENGELREG